MVNTFNRNFFRHPDLTNFLAQQRILKNATDISSSDASPNFVRRPTIKPYNFDSCFGSFITQNYKEMKKQTSGLTKISMNRN